MMQSNEEKGLFAEYESLRNEIIDGKGRRLQTMSFVISAFGVILSIVASAIFGSEVTTVEKKFAVAIGGGVALYGVAIPGLIMILLLQQSIRRTGEYIRIFIEPRVPGLNWQNRWHTYKEQNRLPKGLKGIGSIYYFLSLLPLLLPLYLISQHPHPKNWPLIFILLPLTCWSLYLSYDMHAAISKGWRLAWNLEVEENSEGD